MNKKELICIISLIVIMFCLPILLIVFLHQNYVEYTEVLKPFCDEHCANPKNMSEECGYLTRYPSCNEEDEPDLPFWCYEFRGGKCGVLRTRSYWLLFFWIPGILGLVILLSWAIVTFSIIKDYINKKRQRNQDG